MTSAASRTVIVCFGEALIDFLARPPEKPGAPRQFVEYAGGAPANVAVAAARLGGSSRFIGMLGQDMFGDVLASQFAAAGVDIRYTQRTSAARTALAFVSLDADGERSFSFYRPPAADLLFREQHFGPGCLDDAAVFHVCSNSLTEPDIAASTLAGMRLAREAGALVSMDLNLRPSLWPEGFDPAPRLWAALLEADLVKLCRAELHFLAQPLGSDDEVLGRLLGGRAHCVLITDGAAPVRWFTRTAHGVAPTFATTPVDTTAAGDAFVGALLTRMVAQKVAASNFAEFLAEPSALNHALRHAAASGALATTRHGAFAAMPTSTEVEALMRANA